MALQKPLTVSFNVWMVVGDKYTESHKVLDPGEKQ